MHSLSRPITSTLQAYFRDMDGEQPLVRGMVGIEPVYGTNAVLALLEEREYQWAARVERMDDDTWEVTADSELASDFFAAGGREAR